MAVEESELDEDVDVVEFTPASYSIDLNLPDADEQLLKDASRAIRREYRDSAKWKRLKCRSVRVVSEGETGTVYELQIGHRIFIHHKAFGILARQKAASFSARFQGSSVSQQPNSPP